MEIRMVRVVAIGRMAGDPVSTPDGRVHFQIQATPEGKPFHCICTGRTAENLLKYRRNGDEMTVEGNLSHHQFKTGPKMVIQARFISYGRKLESLAPGDIRGGFSL